MAIELGYEIKNAEEAQQFANDSFERLAALEKEIEVALSELKKMCGMENYSTSTFTSGLGVASAIGGASLFAGAAAVLSAPIVIPTIIGGAGVWGLKKLLGGKDYSKQIAQMVYFQKDTYENLIKVSRVEVLLFEYQRIMAVILNNLFEMCSSNIEVVQSTIETLRARLCDSEKDLSDSTKKDIRDLIRKLMLRQDSLMKQEEMKQEIKRLKAENQEIIKKIDVVMERLG